MEFKDAQKTDLFLLGIGIGDAGQMTRETFQVLQRARVVLHLSAKHKILKTINPNTRDLQRLYWTGETYEKVYSRLRQEVVRELERGPGVALVTYGHPLVFDSVNLALLAWGKRRQLKVKVLPAVSCLDTLCIDLGVDYGNGLQLFEAEQLVDGGLTMNPSLETLVLQLGNFRTSQTCEEFSWKRGHFQPLVLHLMRFYPALHHATIVFSNNGFHKTELVRTRVSRLDRWRKRIFPGATLYVPPLINTASLNSNNVRK